MITLTVGNGLARLIGILAIPVITRLYLPEHLGVLAVFTAFVGILAPVASLRYAVALPLPKSDAAAMHLLVLSLASILTVSVTVALVLGLFGGPIMQVFSMQVLAPWWWLIALGVAATAGYELLTFWATRKRAYKAIAVTSVWQGAAGALFKIALGLLGFIPAGLLFGQVIGQSGGIGYMLRRFGNDLRACLPRLTRARARALAWRYRGFPIYRVPSQFLLAFAMQAPVFYFAASYDAELTGQFSLAVMALMLPINIIGRSTGQSLYAEAAHVLHTDPGQILHMARDVQWRLVLLGLPPAGVLYFTGPKIFALVFGSEWAEAGEFAAILSISLLFQFTSAPLIHLLNLLENQAIFLAFGAARASILVLLFFLATIWELSASSFVAAYAVVMAVFYIGVSFAIMRLIARVRPTRTRENRA